MKLKDRFDTPIMRHDLGRNEIEDTKEQCAEIADEYAIGFGKWILRNFNNYGPNDEKELLEIYKKEKGL